MNDNDGGEATSFRMQIVKTEKEKGRQYMGPPIPWAICYDFVAGPGPWISSELALLHASAGAIVGSLLLLELIDTYLWSDPDRNWPTVYFVGIAFALGACFLLMCAGNIHHSSPKAMIVGILATAGCAVATILAPWSTFRSDTEENILLVSVCVVCSLGVLIQAVLFLRRTVKGELRSTVDVLC